MKQKIRGRELFVGLLASMLVFSAGAVADDEEEGFGGQGAISTEVFDTRETFVPPDELPIKDVYIKEALSLSPEAQREELTAISITPDGKIEELAPSDAAVESMMEMIKAFEAEGGEDSGILEINTDVEGGNESSSAFEGESQLAESVIGSDTRVRVTATTSYPYRAIGRIDIGCTGTLIGPRHVLTAGHCVYNTKNDKWYSSLSFSPGQNGSSSPYGKIGWKRAISVKGWTKNHKRNYDYAMIVLNKDIGNTVGWMGYGWKNPMPKYNININGFPADKPSGTMWHSYCQIKRKTIYRLYYPCDTYNSMSGSAVYVYWPSQNKRTIYGIHAYGVDRTGYNGATRIRKPVFENLKSWKAKY